MKFSLLVTLFVLSSTAQAGQDQTAGALGYIRPSGTTIRQAMQPTIDLSEPLGRQEGTRGGNCHDNPWRPECTQIRYSETSQSGCRSFSSDLSISPPMRTNENRSLYFNVSGTCQFGQEYSIAMYVNGQSEPLEIVTSDEVPPRVSEEEWASKFEAVAFKGLNSAQAAELLGPLITYARLKAEGDQSEATSRRLKSSLRRILLRK